jgi:uncharacterized protein (DUF1330 family)
MADPLAYLVVKTTATDAEFRAFVLAANAAAARAGGNTIIAERLHEVVALEPASDIYHVWAGVFPTEKDRDAVWSDLDGQGWTARLTTPVSPIVLAMPGLPPEGLPDPAIPTAANIMPPDIEGPPAYMLIEGSVSDQARIDGYRGIILPMIAERGGYYIVFAFADQVRVLSGTWTQQVFVFSRWANRALAYDFWLSDRYQSLAIPQRTGAGLFSVLLFDGLDG